jgi:hypothetical protein
MIIVTKKCKISKKELRLGIPIEMEHTTSKKIAKKIASQHLCEFKNYYSAGLIPLEKKLKRLNKKNAI